MILSSFDFFIFSDGSFDANSGVGIGASLPLTQTELLKPAAPIQTKLFHPKTIARLELINLLWALENFAREHQAGSLALVTDSKTIAELKERRTKLEEANFQSKRTSLPLTNADLYRKFFDACDKLNPTIIWVKGHSPKEKRGDLQQIFAQVDRAARRALREYLNDLEVTQGR